MFTVQNDFGNLIYNVRRQLKYETVNLHDEFLVHLKKLNDLATSLADHLDSVKTSFVYNVDEYEDYYLGGLRKKIKKIKFKYKIFRSLSK